MKKLCGCLFFLITTLSVKAVTAEPLFSKGQRHPHYKNLLNLASKAGGTVSFSDQSSFTIRKNLSRQGPTRVLLTTEEEILRLASPGNDYGNHRLLYDFAAEHTALYSSGLVPNILRYGPTFYIPGSKVPLLEYLVVEKVPIRFTLAEWLKKLDISPSRLKQTLSRNSIWQALVQFAQNSWRYLEIADFKAENIVWTGKKWLLIDWASPVHILTPMQTGHETAFTNKRWFRTPKEHWQVADHIYHILDDIVRVERAKNGYCEGLFSHSSSLSLNGSFSEGRSKDTIEESNITGF